MKSTLNAFRPVPILPELNEHSVSVTSIPLENFDDELQDTLLSLTATQGLPDPHLTPLLANNWWRQYAELEAQEEKLRLSIEETEWTNRGKLVDKLFASLTDVARIRRDHRLLQQYLEHRKAAEPAAPPPTHPTLSPVPPNGAPGGRAHRNTRHTKGGKGNSVDMMNVDLGQYDVSPTAAQAEDELAVAAANARQRLDELLNKKKVPRKQRMKQQKQKEAAEKGDSTPEKPASLEYLTLLRNVVDKEPQLAPDTRGLVPLCMAAGAPLASAQKKKVPTPPSGGRGGVTAPRKHPQPGAEEVAYAAPVEPPPVAMSSSAPPLPPPPDIGPPPSLPPPPSFDEPPPVPSPPNSKPTGGPRRIVLGPPPGYQPTPNKDQEEEPEDTEDVPPSKIPRYPSPLQPPSPTRGPEEVALFAFGSLPVEEQKVVACKRCQDEEANERENIIVQENKLRIRLQRDIWAFIIYMLEHGGDGLDDLIQINTDERKGRQAVESEEHTERLRLEIQFLDGHTAIRNETTSYRVVHSEEYNRKSLVKQEDKEWKQLEQYFHERMALLDLMSDDHVHKARAVIQQEETEDWISVLVAAEEAERGLLETEALKELNAVAAENQLGGRRVLWKEATFNTLETERQLEYARLLRDELDSRHALKQKFNGGAMIITRGARVAKALRNLAGEEARGRATNERSEKLVWADLLPALKTAEQQAWLSTTQREEQRHRKLITDDEWAEYSNLRMAFNMGLDDVMSDAYKGLRADVEAEEEADRRIFEEDSLATLTRIYRMANAATRARDDLVDEEAEVRMDIELQESLQWKMLVEMSGEGSKKLGALGALDRDAIRERVKIENEEREEWAKIRNEGDEVNKAAARRRFWMQRANLESLEELNRAEIHQQALSGFRALLDDKERDYVASLERVHHNAQHKQLFENEQLKRIEIESNRHRELQGMADVQQYEREVLRQAMELALQQKMEQYQQQQREKELKEMYLAQVPAVPEPPQQAYLQAAPPPPVAVSPTPSHATTMGGTSHVGLPLYGKYRITEVIEV